MLDLSNRAHAQLTPCFIAFSEPVFIRPAELGGIQQVFFIKDGIISFVLSAVGVGALVGNAYMVNNIGYPNGLNNIVLTGQVLEIFSRIQKGKEVKEIERLRMQLIGGGIVKKR